MYSNLKAEIARKGINRKELAKMAGMSDSSLSLKMSGKVQFKFDDVVQIKKALKTDIPLETLFEKGA